MMPDRLFLVTTELVLYALAPDEAAARRIVDENARDAGGGYVDERLADLATTTVPIVAQQAAGREASTYQYAR